MQKNLLAVISLLVVISAFLVSCKKDENKNNTSPETSENHFSLHTDYESTSEEITSEENNSTTTDLTGIDFTEEIAVSDPTKVNEQNVRVTSLNIPANAKFYSDGKQQTLTAEMSLDIIEEINEEITENYFGQLKLAVRNEDIEKLKTNNYCVELQYNSSQVLHENCDCIEPHAYYFEKVFIVLNGEYECVFFFEKDGQYQNGPIKFYQSDIAEDILKEILDEWVTRPY